MEAGWNTLVGCDPERIAQAALEARPGVESAWPYGDGRAAARIVECWQAPTESGYNAKRATTLK